MYDVINVSITTGEVVSVDKDIKQDWKAKAIRDNAVMRGVVGTLLVVPAGKYKIGDTY